MTLKVMIKKGRWGGGYFYLLQDSERSKASTETKKNSYESPILNFMELEGQNEI